MSLIPQNAVRTSQKTQCHITKINRLMSFRKIIIVYFTMIQNPLTHSLRKRGIYDEPDGTYAGFSNYDATIALVNPAGVDEFSAYVAFAQSHVNKNL